MKWGKPKESPEEQITNARNERHSKRQYRARYPNGEERQLRQGRTTPSTIGNGGKKTVHLIS